MAREETRTPAPTDPADAVRAFYESHPYPAPLGNLDRHRELYRNPDRRRAQSLLLWPTEKPRANRRDPGCRLRNLPGGHLCAARARCAGDGDRHQRNEPALHARSSAKIRLAKPRSSSARDRRGRGTRPDIRSDRLYRRAPPPARPGSWPSVAAQRPCARRRDAPDGLCNIWACRHLYDAGLLPPARRRRHGGGARRPRQHDRGAVCRPSDRRRGAAGQGFHLS